MEEIYLWSQSNGIIFSISILYIGKDIDINDLKYIILWFFDHFLVTYRSHFLENRVMRINEQIIIN